MLPVEQARFDRAPDRSGDGSRTQPIVINAPRRVFRRQGQVVDRCWRLLAAVRPSTSAEDSSQNADNDTLSNPTSQGTASTCDSQRHHPPSGTAKANKPLFDQPDLDKQYIYILDSRARFART